MHVTDREINEQRPGRLRGIIHRLTGLDFLYQGI